MTTGGKSFEQFSQAVIEGATTVLAQIAGQDCKLERGGEAQAANGEVEVQFVCHGALQGAFAFALSKPTALRWAKLLMGEPAGAGEFTEDDSEALDELLRQIAGQAGSRLENIFGKTELQFAGAPALPGESEHIVISAIIGEESMQVELRLSDELARCLAALDAAQENAGNALPQTSPAPAPAVAEQRSVRDDNLELLLDVPLAVVLRFGQREMLLKDILELSPGSVLELDRQVNDPVDLLLDKKVIARGEVVIVDGNYGLRVMAVASPEEKLACLP